MSNHISDADLLACLRIDHANSASNEVDEPSSDEENWTAHLDRCSSCRKRLQRLAAPDSDWQSLETALLSAADENAPSRDNGGNRVGESNLDLSQFTCFLANNDLGPKSEVARNPLESLMRILAPTDEPSSAGRIGNFEVTGLIGHGGMGVVLKAREPSLDRFVAIKVLAPHLASSKSARKRFAREARAAAAVIHENVVPIYQVAEWESLPYFVMPYWPAPSLGQRLEDDGPMSLQATLVIGMQVARGLAAAHTQGLVHRDVKPANILLSKGTDRAVITDFGLARAADDASLTQAGTLAGTPHYMSPEQARGETVDPKSDLFSLGSVIFAMLCGSPPISEESGTATIKRIRVGKLPALNGSDKCPDWMIRLVAWLHHDDPAKRPKSAGQVADLLEQCLAHLRMPEKTQVPEVLRNSSNQKSKSGIWIAAASLLLACVFMVGYRWIPNDAAHLETNKDTSGHVSDSSVTVDLASDSEQPDSPTNQRRNQDPSTLNGPNTGDISPTGLDWHLTELQLRALEGDIESLEQQLNTFDTNETVDQPGDQP